MDKNKYLWSQSTPYQSLTRKQQLLFNAHAIDSTMLTALSAITADQANPTEKALLKIKRFYK